MKTGQNDIPNNTTNEFRIKHEKSIQYIIGIHKACKSLNIIAHTSKQNETTKIITTQKMPTQDNSA